MSMFNWDQWDQVKEVYLTSGFQAKFHKVPPSPEKSCKSSWQSRLNMRNWGHGPPEMPNSSQMNSVDELWLMSFVILFKFVHFSWGWMTSQITHYDTWCRYEALYWGAQLGHAGTLRMLLCSSVKSIPKSTFRRLLKPSWGLLFSKWWT